jgi:hypothetical protein
MLFPILVTKVVARHTYYLGYSQFGQRVFIDNDVMLNDFGHSNDYPLFNRDCTDITPFIALCKLDNNHERWLVKRVDHNYRKFTEYQQAWKDSFSRSNTFSITIKSINQFTI